MLRELITWVLNTYLGKYLEDFNSAQLSVALLSGEVELENVPIRKDALRNFGLPLQVLSGTIGKIKLQIPVRQFRTAPWCIIIEKIFVVVGPKNSNDWDDEKERQTDLEYKLSQLEDAEAKWRAVKGGSMESSYYASSYSSWLSYGTGLVTNIVENLELKVNNVHIRYEDAITIPNFRLASGMTIQSLTAQSCTSNWLPGTKNSLSEDISYKLVELKEFSFYWDRLTNDNMCSSMLSSTLVQKMEKVCSGKHHRYIIIPISAQAQCKHDRSLIPLRTRLRPRLSCEVTVTELNISLTDFQYTQMVDCISGLQTISKLRSYRVNRPTKPVAGNSRLWWHYAIKCHGFKLESSKEKWEKVKCNIRYIKLYKKLLVNPNESLSSDDKQFKLYMEKLRNVCELRALREACFLHLHLADLNLQVQNGNKGKSMLFQWFPNWWGWYENLSTGNDTMTTQNLVQINEENTQNLEDDILNALEGSVENNSLLKRDAVFGKFKFALASGSFFVLSEHLTSAEAVTMMEMHFDNLNLNVEIRPRSGSHIIGISLGSVCVKDLFTANTEFPHLIKPQAKEQPQTIPLTFSRFFNKTKKNTSTGVHASGFDSLPQSDANTLKVSEEPWFQLQYEKKPLSFNTDFRLFVKTRSLDIVYNLNAFKWLTDFFTNPLQNINAKNNIKYSSKLKFLNNWKSIIDGDLGQRKSWSLEINISAPQIIFVENFSNENTNIVLVDFGRFKLLKNATDSRVKQIRQLSNSEKVYRDSEVLFKNTFNRSRDSEEDEAFMTPCSTPPGSENSLSESPTLCSAAPEMSEILINEDNGLESAFHDKIYDKYTIDLTDLQVLVCENTERWGFASSKGSSVFHLLDRFSIALQLKRRVVHTADPEYPSLTLFGTLPKLVAHVNEQKISSVFNILSIISAGKSATATLPSFTNTPADQFLSNSLFFKLGEEYAKSDENLPQTIRHSNLVVLQFVIDQMCLEVQSRERSIAELQITGARAGFSRSLEETYISMSVHGLLLVDAIQSFGPDFELLIASHRHVGMDSVSGSLRHSEPCSPTSPSSPDSMNKRPPNSPEAITSAITSLEKVNSASWSNLDNSDALITVEINFINSMVDKDALQIANINFNNLDIIANQETIVELLGFINRVVPIRKSIESVETASSANNRHINNFFTETGACAPILRVRREITFDFNRLNILVVRALTRDTHLVGRKVGTFIMSEAKIHASLGMDISFDGSLGGLQILDLTPEGVNHQRILSVGKDPLSDPPKQKNLLNSLKQEVYKYQSKEIFIEQRQALSFFVSRDANAVVNVKVRMASVWYTHCARFAQEISLCATEFKHYLKKFARSIREKATDMAIGLVKPIHESHDHIAVSPTEKTSTSSFTSRKTAKTKHPKNVEIKIDIVLDTPVLVLPRSSCSGQVLVAHLGKITVLNNQKEICKMQEKANVKNDRNILTIDDDDLEKPEEHDRHEICDNYSIAIRNINLFSLDTMSRKAFQVSVLPRAEEFYSCKYDAVAILHDTAIQLYVSKHSIKSEINQLSSEETLGIDGSVTELLQVSLSRKQYEQLLETLENIFKVDLICPIVEVSNDRLKHLNLSKIESDLKRFESGKINERINNIYQSTNLVGEAQKHLTTKILFSLPTFIIKLKNEQDNPLIEITFREFSVKYDRLTKYETLLQVMLRSILMEDLKCPNNSKYRQMVVSFSNDNVSQRCSAFYPSSSCPDLVGLNQQVHIRTGSLPDNLERSTGFEKHSLVELRKIHKHRQTGTPCYPETPPSSPQPKSREDNLVIYSALLIDTNCPSLMTQHQNRRQTSNIDFNSLNLIISVERWFMFLDFFGLVSDNVPETKCKTATGSQAVEPTSNGNSELKITVRSLNLVFVRNESELAKANVSNAFFVVANYDQTKTIEGRLGSVSLYDLTDYGHLYREKFLTSGSEALNFIYKREGFKRIEQRSLKKDATLRVQMSSIRYVHTKRFVMEIQSFIKEFIQLQTPVMKKIKSSDLQNYSGRPSQLGLEISAGSPIIQLPLSYISSQVIVADLGEFSLTNTFCLASEEHVISKKYDLTLMDEILDVMQVNLVNTNLFSGDRISKNKKIQRYENTDICLDMGSYWILKRGKSIFKDKCYLKLQVERNMDSNNSHNCPDVSVQGNLSRLSGVLSIDQYKLVRGFLLYNLGETIEDIYQNYSFSLPGSCINLTSAEEINDSKALERCIWNNLSINLDLEDVSILLNQYKDLNTNEEQSLACIHFIKSCLRIDSYSDGSQDIDLVSQEILITDSRYQANIKEKPNNVFINILQPIRGCKGSNMVQAEVHSRKRKDCIKYTILLNNMRIMAIIDWIENVQDYLIQNADLPSSEMLQMRNTGVLQGSNSLEDIEKVPLEVILNITESELVFVEKTEEHDTNAVILKSTTVFSFKQSDLSRPVSVNLNHLEVFSCILGCESETALSIIDPITLNVDLRNNTIDILIQKQLCVRLSYHDVKMFIKMLESLPKQTRTGQKNTKKRNTNIDFEVIAPLIAMGFIRTDCIQAMENANFKLNEAAILLTQKKQRQSLPSMQIHSININAQCISVIVIDDCKDSDVPVLELSFSLLYFKQILNDSLCLQKEDYTINGTLFSTGQLDAVIASHYYNRRLSGWEPVIEPWECTATWSYCRRQTENENNLLNLCISSKQLLKFNITTTLVELWNLVRNNWTHDYYEGSNKSFVNLTTNLNQSIINYRMRTPFIPFSLRNDTGEPLQFQTLVTQPGGITRTELTHDVISNWITVPSSDTVPFSFGPQSKLRHIDSHKQTLHQILVQIQGWTCVGPVSIDKEGIFFRHASHIFEEMAKTRVVFDISLMGSAQKLITVRSALKVINRLDQPILINMNKKLTEDMQCMGRPEINSAIIETGQHYSIPLNLVSSNIFFKPLYKVETEDGRNGKILCQTEAKETTSVSVEQNCSKNPQFGYCSRAINWTTCLNDVSQEQRVCHDNRDNVYNVVVSIKREKYPHRETICMPGHTIILIPPLRIINLLCCDLLYKIAGRIHGRINPSVTANIYEVNLDEPINLSITLDNYKISGQLKIPVGHIGVVEPKLKLLDINNRDLHLRVSIHSVKGNGMKIFISSPFWLVNKTGLPLIFRQEGVSHPSSGQFEEHETARVVTPLMFSFSDSDASPTLEVRLGNRYGDNNQWCQGFCLYKDTLHRQLKTADSNENFAIGVTVRRGRGRYSRTSVVTFSPRFLLYNRSSHKLQFAQKCFVTKYSSDSRGRYINAVPGCHFPFHWPRCDQEPLLCLRLADVEFCHWSSGIPINEAQSLYITIRNSSGEMQFLRLEVILQGSTFFLLFGDAYSLPPPIRLDNYSEVPITFFQYGCKPQWQTSIRPHSSLAYALDDPTKNHFLQIEAPGGNSITFPLRDIGYSCSLTYSNFIYIALKATFQTPSISENLFLNSEYDIENQHLVLGVRDKKVILMRKCAGDRSQLWLMNTYGQLEHEGSSSPTEPGKIPSNFKTRLVLDLEKAPNPMDYTNIVVRYPNKQRETTQTWRFENGRLMCHANMCVQARNGVFGIRPGSEVVLGRIESDTRTRHDECLPIEQSIERQKLRPGSGHLEVASRMDGPIRTIHIKDVKTTNFQTSLTPDPIWKHASGVNTKSYKHLRESSHGFIDQYSIKIMLVKGVGISVISSQPCEELAYITLHNVAIEAVATPKILSVDLKVNELQIDNQLFESPCPIFLYTSKSNTNDMVSPNALSFGAKVLPSPNENAVIIEYLIFHLTPCIIYLEERLLLKTAKFLGLGANNNLTTSLADESEYEAQQVETHVLAINANRYYFENLHIGPSQIRLSVVTASKLSPHLTDIKKRLGLTLIKFEDALIDFDKFTDKHHFETLEVYVRALKSHYKNQIKWHAASILGSVDILGNPLGFANDLSEGVSGLIFEGSVKSLVKNVTHGISNSTAKLTETISDGLGRVILDEQDNEARQKILEVSSGSKTSGDHLAAGLKGFGFGLLGGVTSIVRYTYSGAQSDGIHGFISGLGKGIVGTLTKPLIGVLDLASETASAVRETSKSAHRILPERKRLPRCVTGAPGGLLPQYSFRQSKGQQYLHIINKRNFSEQLLSYEQNLCNDRDAKLRLLVTTEYIRIFSRNEEEPSIMLECHLSEVLSCHPVSTNGSGGEKISKGRNYIEISTNSPKITRPRVRCQTEEMAEKTARSINYAKSVYDEREQTFSYEQSHGDI